MALSVTVNEKLRETPRNILKRPIPPGEGVGPLVRCILRTFRRVDGAILDGVRTILAGGDVVNAQRLVVPILEGYGVSRPCRISRGQSAVVGDVRQRRASPAEESIGVACIIRSGRRLDLTGFNRVRHSGAVGHNAPEQDRIVPVLEGDDIADILNILRDEIRVPGDVFEALVPANIPESGMAFGILVRYTSLFRCDINGFTSRGVFRLVGRHLIQRRIILWRAGCFPDIRSQEDLRR